MNDPIELARRGAVVVAEPELGCLVATGPDRISWLNAIVSCDVSKVSPGIGQWGLSLTKTGKILSELYVVASTDAIFIATSPGTAGDLLQSFDRMLVMEDAEIAERSAELAWIVVHGARAVELAAERAARLGAAWGAIDFSGFGGAALVVPRKDLQAATRELAQGDDVAIASAAESERLRIERGVPRFGVDFDSKDNPHEASLDQRAVSWTKGCYLGQEVVCMQDMRGKVKRRLVSLSLGGAAPPVGASVSLDGEDVGEVTSSAASSDQAFVIARVRTPFDEPGRTLAIDGRPATVRDTAV